MFDNGSQIFRFDCHLHTESDKEFDYKGDANRFVSDYVDKLVSEGISVGIITNHNKFDCEQYKAIKKAAKKKDIFILPGVELSIKEGASSIHMLIVFDPKEWLVAGNDYISRNIDAMFLGISDPGNENTYTKNDLLAVIDMLDKQDKDYFMICAHVEQSKGFWEECRGTLIESLSSDKRFRKRVLAFQKARTRDLIKKVHDWMGYDLAFVEGSDPKSIDEIGKGEKAYIKIGDLSYSAVKYALIDHENRVYNEFPQIKHGYIKEMRCIGGKLDNQVFSPSHELNTLIGIRGSGKPSVLEVLRYALNIKPAQDKDYKDELVKTSLGPGGKVELTIVDRFGKVYSANRIYGDKCTIYDVDGNELSVPIEEIIQKPLYFGQKDLALTKKGYEYELLKKIVGNKVSDITEDENNIQKQLMEDIDKLRLLSDIQDKIKDINSENTALQHRLKVYVEKGIAEKLKKQTSCNADWVKIDSIYDWIQELSQSFEMAYLKDGRDLLILDNYESQYNKEIFNELAPILEQGNAKIDSIKKELDDLKNVLNNIGEVRSKLLNKIDSLRDEFAEIKRDINDEQLDADSYVNDQKKLTANGEKISKLKEILKSKEKISADIKENFDRRNKLLRANYEAYENAAREINDHNKQLSISIEYKGDKISFKEELMTFFKGTNLSEVKYNELCEAFTDMSDIVEDYYLENGEMIKEFCTDSIFAKVANKIEDGFKEMLVYDTPNTINISYHGKPLSKHSLGQRASALILFLLTQNDSDVIIVDQPEDDLDNQVIYEELIQTIKKEKKNMQFIFATHNANISVLGDAERVVTTEYDDGLILLRGGTIDSEKTHADIVNIMEGGEKAFKKRNEIYEGWK